MPTRDQPRLPWTRRHFGARAACAFAACHAAQVQKLLAQSPASQPASTPPALGSTANALRPDVAAIDRERILQAAQRVLSDQPTPVTELTTNDSPGGANEYFSEEEAEPGAGGAAQPAPYTAHRDALFALGDRVAALTAAQLLSGDQKYGNAAAAHLRAWFVDPRTRMLPSLLYGQTPQAAPQAPSHAPAAGPAAKNAGTRSGTFQGILETLPLVEVVQAIPFLSAAGSLSRSDGNALTTWFRDYLHWLTAPEDTGPRLPALARDHGDHHATSWMLQVAAYTLFTLPSTGAPKSEDRAMTELRHRFHSVTLRTQISQEGVFRKEISSPNPYRNSLFNLDMLACLCVLLSTRFDNVWEYQLEDGPGMRVAVAFHFPFIANRAKWPYRADAHFFNQLPSRRANLLFAARAYQRPEYATLWKTLDPDPHAVEVLRTMPARQPLLWVRQPPRQVSE